MTKIKVQWLTGNLRGIIQEIEWINPRVGQVCRPYGCSGKFEILEVK